MTALATVQQYADYARRWGLELSPDRLSDALAGATAEAQEFCGREFAPSPMAGDETETRYTVGDGLNLLSIPDALTVASVTVAGSATTSYRAEPAGAAPYTRLVRTDGGVWANGAQVAVTGRFGYAELADIPEPVRRAVCMLAAVELSSAGAWGRELDGVKSERVLNVQVDYGSPGGEDQRTRALALLERYRRAF